MWMDGKSTLADLKHTIFLGTTSMFEKREDGTWPCTIIKREKVLKMQLVYQTRWNCIYTLSETAWNQTAKERIEAKVLRNFKQSIERNRSHKISHGLTPATEFFDCLLPGKSNFLRNIRNCSLYVMRKTITNIWKGSWLRFLFFFEIILICWLHVSYMGDVKKLVIDLIQVKQQKSVTTCSELKTQLERYQTTTNKE